MKFARRILVLFVVMSVFLVSCTNSRTRFYDSSIEKDTLQIVFKRFDWDLFTLDTTALAAKYGDFLEIYTYRVLNLRSVSELSKFTSDSGIIRLKSDVERVYPVVGGALDVERKLTTAFKYYHRYFPEKQVPKVMFHISGFNQAMVVTDGVLSASVEQYLGSDYEPYQYVAYGYEIPFMTPQQLPIDMMYAWLSSSFTETLNGDQLLDMMIYQGKLLYLQKVFFPDADECTILSYTKQQYDWCKRFEREVWNNIMESRELFSSDWRVNTKYMSPAPFTSGLSQESPGRIGAYIGLQIVKSYIDRNEDVTLQELMKPSDSRKFLQDAAYRP